MEHPYDRTRTEESPNTETPGKSQARSIGESVVRVIVTSRELSKLKGKEQKAIKVVAEEAQCRIKILDRIKESDLRVILVNSENEAAVMEGVMLINSLFSSSTGSCNRMLLCQTNQSCSLVGKAGVQVKEIVERTGAYLRVNQATDYQNGNKKAVILHVMENDAVVEISGDVSQVKAALKDVLGILIHFKVDRTVLPLFELTPPALMPFKTYQDLPVPVTSALRRSTFNPEVKHNLQLPLASVDEIIGESGENIRRIRESSGCLVDISESKETPAVIVVAVTGDSNERVLAAQEIIYDFISGVAPSS